MAAESYVAAEPLRRGDSTIDTLLSWLHLVFGFVWAVLLGLFRSIVHFLTPSKLKNIENQVALVTGGGNGLGRAICIELARNGCHVAIADVDLDGGEKTAQDLREMGVKSMAYKVDVSDYEKVQQLQKNIENDVGPVDILVNNAGLLTNVSLLEGKADEIQRVVNVNLTGYLWTSRVFLPGMHERGRGHIVAISSILGYESSARAIAYSATKSGIRGMMDALSEELRHANSPVRTTTVYPTLIHTRRAFIEQITEAMSSRFKMLLNAANTPEEVALSTVHALRTNKRHVFLNSVQEIFVRSIALFPVCFQDTVRDYLKPRVSQLFMADVVDSKQLC